MQTLTDVAYYTRKAINWGAIGIVIFLVLRFLLNSTIEVWRNAHPPPPPPPNMAFGKLPALKLPESEKKAGELKFSLETIEGKAYFASASAAVYFIPKPAPNLLTLTRARQFASRLGFENEPTTGDQIIFHFVDSNFPLRTLDYDIITNNFELNYNYGSDLSLFSQKNLPSAAQAINEAKNFLQNFGLYSASLAGGENKITYLSLSGSSLIETTSFSNADAIRVDLGRANLEGIRFFTKKPGEELVYFIFSPNSDSDKKILKVSYRFWPIESFQRATYPLKNAQIAYQELISDKGYIAGFSPNPNTENPDRVLIQKIYLGFYYPDEYQQFLQPVYVFEGDPGFLGYVPAIDPAWAQ